MQEAGLELAEGAVCVLETLEDGLVLEAGPALLAHQIAECRLSGGEARARVSCSLHGEKVCWSAGTGSQRSAAQSIQLFFDPTCETSGDWPAAVTSAACAGCDPGVLQPGGLQTNKSWLQGFGEGFREEPEREEERVLEGSK